MPSPTPPPPPSGRPPKDFDPMDVLTDASPRARKATIAATPTKRLCPFCAEEIQPTAIKCKHCGELLDEGVRRQRTVAAIQDKPLEKAWNPGIAALLSFIIPGAGQIYKGELVTGLFYFSATMLLIAVYGPPGAAMWLAAIVFAFVGDPYSAAKKERAKKLENI